MGRSFPSPETAPGPPPELFRRQGKDPGPGASGPQSNQAATPPPQQMLLDQQG